MISAISSHIGFIELNDSKENRSKEDASQFKLRQVALAFFAGICLLFGGLLLASGTFKALFYALPFFISAGIAIWTIQRSWKDYDNPLQLARYRMSAVVSPLQETVKEHGWENLFKYEIPLAKQFHKLFMKAAHEMNMHELLDFYEGAFKAKELYPESKLELPNPREFSSKWNEEINGLSVKEVIGIDNEDRYLNIERFVKYGFINPDFLKAQKVYLNAKIEMIKNIDMIFCQKIQSPLKTLLTAVQNETTNNFSLSRDQKSVINRLVPWILYLQNPEAPEHQKLHAYIEDLNDCVKHLCEETTVDSEGIKKARIEFSKSTEKARKERDQAVEKTHEELENKMSPYSHLIQN